VASWGEVGSIRGCTPLSYSPMHYEHHARLQLSGAVPWTCSP
jgi:hypothetical protein